MILRNPSRKTAHTCPERNGLLVRDNQVYPSEKMVQTSRCFFNNHIRSWRHRTGLLRFSRWSACFFKPSTKPIKHLVLRVQSSSEAQIPGFDPLSFPLKQLVSSRNWIVLRFHFGGGDATSRPDLTVRKATSTL